MKLTIVALALLLAGCATAYDPNVQDVRDPVQVSIDKSDCAAMAKAYRRPFNLGTAGAAAGQGVAGNLSSAAVGPVGPALGGAGGFLGALFQWLGFLDTDTPRATQQCVRQRLDRDHAGILVEPPL